MRGRWKSHLQEAIGRKGDHCRILNQAIRKYGKDNFTVTKIEDVAMSEIDAREVECIKKYNTITPNGYNLTTGGKNYKASDNSRKYQNEKRPDTKSKPKGGLGQMGLVRTQKRKFEEDNKLPKHIGAIREDGVIIGYCISCFPIGIDKPEYYSKSITNREHPEVAYKKIIKHLKELEEKYSERLDKIKEVQAENDVKRIKKTLFEKYREKCPEYVFPIITGNKLDGYYVEGYPDTNNGVYPKKAFNELFCNRLNKLASIRYVKQLEIKNQNATFTETITGEVGLKSKVFNLPKHITYERNREKEIIGYHISYSQNGARYQKKFCDTHLPMEEKYKNALQYLEELKNNN